MIKYAQFVLWDDCVGHVEPVPVCGSLLIHIVHKLLYFIYILTLGDFFNLLLYIQVIKHNICDF